MPVAPSAFRLIAISLLPHPVSWPPGQCFWVPAPWSSGSEVASGPASVTSDLTPSSQAFLNPAGPAGYLKLAVAAGQVTLLCRFRNTGFRLAESVRCGADGYSLCKV